MKDEEMEVAARKALADALSVHGNDLLSRAVRSAHATMIKLQLAGSLPTPTAELIIADVWLDGWIAHCDEVDARAKRS